MTTLLALLTVTAAVSAVLVSSVIVRGILLATSAVLAVAALWRHRHDQWRREWSPKPPREMRDAE
jgi:hypothetical protein